MRESKYVIKKTPIHKRKQLYIYLIGVFIISIMVFSVINLNSETEKIIEYNGLKFIETSSSYIANKENRQIQIITNPKDLKDIQTQKINLNTLNSLSKIYISLNPYSSYQTALYDFYRNINLAPLKIDACYEDSELCSNLPIKTCADATSTIGVIIFKEANETLVSLNSNCLIIQGKDLLKVTDKLILDQYV